MRRCTADGVLSLRGGDPDTLAKVGITVDRQGFEP